MFSPAFFNLEISQSMYVHGRNLKNDELKIHHLPLICQKNFNCCSILKSPNLQSLTLIIENNL